MGPVRIALAAAAVLAAAVTACSGPAPSAGSDVGSAPAAYYLALGDSLSQGVQPDAAGTSVETGEGYPDQLYAVLRRSQPALQLVSSGARVRHRHHDPRGDLPVPRRFPAGRRGRVPERPPRPCGPGHHRHRCQRSGRLGTSASLRAVTGCLGTDLPDVTGNLGTILSRLRAAAGPGVDMVGNSYYLPALAEWRNGLTGQTVAWVSERLAAGYNDLLDRAYATSGVRVANVFGAFETSDFGNRVTVPGVGSVPRNVARICQWTWECTSPPRGPNQHANQAGYGVMAQAFLSAAGL